MKRRQLPAWIREGLEKMEREKQRQLDKEKQEQEALAQRQAEEAAERERRENGSDGLAAIKSKFVRWRSVSVRECQLVFNTCKDIS